MSTQKKAQGKPYIDYSGPHEQAVRAAYKHGVAAQRQAWAKWFWDLPPDLKAAITAHRQGRKIKYLPGPPDKYCPNCTPGNSN